MSEGYHPEVDDSPLYTENDYAFSTVCRFNMLPKEGQLKAVKRILPYLKAFPNGRVIIDTSYPDHSVYPVE
jgi:hypothetical protein